MDISEVITKATAVGLKIYGDSAVQRFFELLRERKFQTTRCKKCGYINWPPRSFCPKCFSDSVEWFDLPRRGKVWAFTTQERAVRFMVPDKIGFVELEGVGKRILTKIEGDDVKLDDEVELDFIEIHGLVLHKFIKR